MNNNNHQSGSIPYFYVPDIEETHRLSRDEAQHAYKVLRLSAGADINITDGAGHLYSAKLLSNDLRKPIVTDLQLIQVANKCRAKLELAIAPTKNLDRIEWLLERLTEIGISRFSIVITDRAVRRKVNTERLQKVMVAAMKQSEKLTATCLRVFDSLQAYLEQQDYNGKYIGYCANRDEKRLLKEVFRSGVDSSFLIGPEGDFTSEEVELAEQYGFLPVSLGDERLRTETAGIYVGMFHHITNE